MRLSAFTVTACAVIAFGVPTAAYAGPGEPDFTARTNSSRAAAGRAPYAVASDLVALARRHSAAMAAKGDIWHNPTLSRDVANWRAVGENVGMGQSPASLHQALMNSPAHRANILDRDFTEVGIGTAVGKDGTLYVTEVFRQPLRARTAVRRPVTRRPARTVTRRTSRPAAPSRPVVRPAPKPKVDPLRARLAHAAAVAGRAQAAGPFDQAITYVEVMATFS